MPKGEFNVDVEDLNLRVRKLATHVLLGLADVKGNGAVEAIVQQAVVAAGCVEMNFNHACRVRSKDDFFARMPDVVESAEEVLYWLKLAERTETIPAATLEPLLKFAAKTSAALRAVRRGA